MVSVDYIRILFEYNAWARSKFWDCLLTVSDDDFVRDVPYSLGSLHHQTVHTMWAEALWLARFEGKPRVSFTTEDYPSRGLIRDKWAAIHQDWQVYLAKLDDQELVRKFEVTRLNGESYQQIIWQTLIHIVNHGTDHRSQMLRIIHDFGGQTFEQDMVFYFRSLE